MFKRITSKLFSRKSFSQRITRVHCRLTRIALRHTGSAVFILGCDPTSKQFVTLGLGPYDEAVRMFAHFIMADQTQELAMDALATASKLMDQDMAQRQLDHEAEQHEKQSEEKQADPQVKQPENQPADGSRYGQSKS